MSVPGLEVEQRDDVVLARISGEVDLANAADLANALGAAISNAALGLVVDLSETGYLDSAGVHMLFELAERLTARQQTMRVVVPEGGRLRRVLDVVALDETVPILASVDEALASLRTQDG